MEFEFDRTTALRPRDGGFEADLDPGWVVGGGVNGGYLLAVVGTAVRQSLADKPHPFSLSAHYLSPSRPGPARVTTDVVREGRTLSTARAELFQDGQRRITALATYGDLGSLPGEVHTSASPPDVPPLEQCVATAQAPEEVRRTAPILERFDLRLDPASVGWVVGAPSGRGVIQGWTRLADGREPDPLSLLMFCDSLPPVTYDLGLTGWAPTLELTCHVRAVPAPGWLRIRHATSNLANGMFEADCDIWDSADRLVAQSRQLAFAPRS